MAGVADSILGFHAQQAVEKSLTTAWRNLPCVAVLRNKRVRSYLLWMLVIAVGVANALGIWATRLLTGFANIFLLLVVIAYGVAWLIERRRGRDRATRHDDAST